MPKQPKRDTPLNKKALVFDEDGVIVNGRSDKYYVPKDPLRKHRLWIALGWKRGPA